MKATTTIASGLLLLACCLHAAEDGPPRTVAAESTVEMAGLHPRDGREELAPLKVQLELDRADYDPLYGATYRGNLMRNGQFKTRGVAKLKGLKWKKALGGPVKSQPVCVDGVVYVGGTTGFYALDATTGEQKWKKDIKGGTKSTACVTDGTVYVGGNNGRLMALDAATGETKWEVKTRYGGKERVYTSPGVAYGVVFTDPGIGFDAETGKRVWTIGDRDFGTPQDGRRSSICVLPELVILRASVADLKYGKWKIGRGDSWEKQNCNAFLDGIFYGVNSGSGGNMADIHIWAKALTDWHVHQRRWIQKILPPEQREQRCSTLCSPAAWGGTVYISSDRGTMCAFDAARGKRLWGFDANAAVRSSPSISTEDGMLYFGCDSGTLYALDAKTGEKKWEYQTDGKIDVCPAVADRVVYVSSDDGHVHAMEGEDAESRNE